MGWCLHGLAHVAMMPEHIQQPTHDGLNLLICDARRGLGMKLHRWLLATVEHCRPTTDRAPLSKAAVDHPLHMVVQIQARIALSKLFLRCGHPVPF